MPLISYAQNFEDVTLWRALSDVTRGFFIDVGAWDADLHSVTRAFSERGWRGVNVEPVPDLCARIASRRPRDVTVCLAIGATSGECAFYNVAGSGLSTVHPAAAAAYEAQGWKVEQFAVQVKSLAQLCREHAPETIHFLKVDCEGGERDVLLGADFENFRPWIILVEATEPLSQTPSFEGWEPILIEAGYQFAWFDGLNRFYVSDEKWADLKPRLALPPNCFDDFILSRNIQPWPPVPTVLKQAMVPGLPGSRPAVLSDDGRIDLASRNRDCDDLPKVSDAGLIRFEQDGTAVQVMHNGLLVSGFDACSWSHRLIARCDGHLEPQAERLFHDATRLLPRNASMIELGGQWGYFSACFVQGAPHRKVVIVQPDESDLADTQRTMTVNSLQATLVLGNASAVPIPLVPVETVRSGNLLVPSYNVPQLMQEQGIQHLDLLRCDLGGVELAVLQGCVDLFDARRIGLTFVSTFPPSISGDPLNHDRCLDLLRSHGAVIVSEYDVYESFSGAGLIVASFAQQPEGWRPVAVSRAPRNQAVFRHPSFELAEARAQLSALARQPGSPVDETPFTPDLAGLLQRYGTVYPSPFSQAGPAVNIGNSPVFEADGTPGIFLLHGPYCVLGVGRYECTFLVRAGGVGTLTDAPALYFDTADQEPEAHLKQQACLCKELAAGIFVPVQFAFQLKLPVSRFETRLRVAGPLAMAAVAAVAIRRVE